MTRKLRRNTATNRRTQWTITATVAIAVGLGLEFAAPADAPTRPARRRTDVSVAPAPALKTADEARMKADLYGYLLDLVHEDPALFEKITKRILAAPEDPKQHMIALRALTTFGTRDPLPELCRVVTNRATPAFIRAWAHRQIQQRCKANPSLRPAVQRMLAVKPSL